MADVHQADEDEDVPDAPMSPEEIERLASHGENQSDALFGREIIIASFRSLWEALSEARNGQRVEETQRTLIVLKQLIVLKHFQLTHDLVFIVHDDENLPFEPLRQISEFISELSGWPDNNGTRAKAVRDAALDVEKTWRRILTEQLNLPVGNAFPSAAPGPASAGPSGGSSDGG